MEEGLGSCPALLHFYLEHAVYLTPTRFRSMNTGLDLSAQSDADLQSILFNAATLVNSAVHAPAGFSFLGGSVTGETHQWKVTSRAPKQTDGRLWPYMRPVKSASLVRIYVTRNQYIDFDANNLFVQTDLSYVEPVGGPTTTGLFTAIPPFLLTSPEAAIDYDYGWNFSIIDEVLTSVSGGILQANHQYWYTDEDVVLKKDNVVVDPGDYTVDYDEGWITPTTPPAGEVYKGSYHYKLPPGIAAASSLIATDMLGQSAIAASGMLGLSGIKVEEVELRQSAKINFMVQPVNAAARVYLGPYAAMFTSMR